MSMETVRKHIRTLAGAWNRVRDGHPELVAGVAKSKRATENPWEAVRNNLPKPKRKAPPVQFRLDNGDLMQITSKNHRVR